MYSCCIHHHLISGNHIHDEFCVYIFTLDPKMMILSDDMYMNKKVYNVFPNTILSQMLIDQQSVNYNIKLFHPTNQTDKIIKSDSLD